MKKNTLPTAIICIVAFTAGYLLFGLIFKSSLFASAKVFIADNLSGSTTASTNLSGDKGGLDKAKAEAEANTVLHVDHVITPTNLKALYMTSWVGGTPSLRDNLISLIDTTEANAVVLDIKDYTGKIAFETGNPVLDSGPCIEKRIKDIKGLIQTLHDKNIYVIGRVSVFQDPCYVLHHPETAVKRKTDGKIWKDRKGISWVDMSSKEIWGYTAEIAKTAYGLGFDEINFDYVRFPSDGDMTNIVYLSGQTPKPLVFKSFFEYLDKELRGGKAWYKKAELAQGTSTASTTTATTAPTPAISQKVMKSGMTMAVLNDLSGSAEDPVFDEYHNLVTGITPEIEKKRADAIKNKTGVGRMVTSADLFGMVTTQTDDLGIGQVLEYALPFVDHVYPMVYPSHYPANWNGFKNPAAEPYKVIQISMKKSAERAEALGLSRYKLRPWIQDFNLGATYTADMVKQQFKATYDAGLSGWLVWNASNKYTKAALVQ